MKKRSFLVLMLFVAAAACATPTKKPLIQSKTTHTISTKKLQAFHARYTKQCDVAFANNDMSNAFSSVQLLNRKGWLTINGRPMTGSCFNIESHKLFQRWPYGTFLQAMYKRRNFKRIEEKSVFYSEKVTAAVIDQYFMALYSERFRPITSQEARAYYNQNKTQLRVPAKMALNAIIVHNNDKQTIADGKKPVEIIKEIYAELQQNPSRFEVFASKYSNRPADHGRLFVLMSTLRGDFIKTLKVNETSKPIPIEHFGDIDGYVIFRKVVRKESYLPSFESLKIKIKEDLFLKKKDALKDIKARYDIKILRGGSFCYDC